MAISSVLGSSALLPAGLGFRNVLINGAMQIAQRSTSVASITSGAGAYNTVDRWKMWSSTAGTWTQTQSTDAPAGFGYSLKMQCTTANASLSAGSYLFFQQEIEGQNLQQFAKGTSSAKSMMLSFWVKAFQVGVYAIELYDTTNSRHVTLPYTVNVSGTWEYKTVQIPADATGAFANSNASALAVGFWFVAGTNYTSGTANGLWGAEVTGKRAVGLNVNSASSTNNYFQFTGVQLEQNLQPTPFEQRPIGVELALCQRYYEKTYSASVSAGTSTTEGAAHITGATDGGGFQVWSFRFLVSKRNDAYTVTAYTTAGSVNNWTYGRSGASGSVGLNIDYKATGGFRVYISTGVGWVPCQMFGHWVVDAEL